MIMDYCYRKNVLDLEVDRIQNGQMAVIFDFAYIIVYISISQVAPLLLALEELYALVSDSSWKCWDSDKDGC